MGCFELPSFPGDEGHYEHLNNASLVHVDDVARAHIHLFEHPDAKGDTLLLRLSSKLKNCVPLFLLDIPNLQCYLLSKFWLDLLHFL
ncbi:hypothetical protein ACS0TY_020116 [Phlomoides rotata]